MTFLRAVPLLLIAALAPAQTAAKKAETADSKGDPRIPPQYGRGRAVYERVYADQQRRGVEKMFRGQCGRKCSDAGRRRKRLRACPGAAAILKTARIKPREFMVITGALFSDFIAVGLKRHGSAKEYPATISPENAAFIDQNFDKLQAMMAPAFAGEIASQCRKWRTPVNTIAMFNRSAASITSESRTEPPGWITAVIPCFRRFLHAVGEGKERIPDAITHPASGSTAFMAATFTESTYGSSARRRR